MRKKVLVVAAALALAGFSALAQDIVPTPGATPRPSVTPAPTPGWTPAPTPPPPPDAPPIKKGLPRTPGSLEPPLTPTPGEAQQKTPAPGAAK